jgi:hypothetical protein
VREIIGFDCGPTETNDGGNYGPPSYIRPLHKEKKEEILTRKIFNSKKIKYG